MPLKTEIHIKLRITEMDVTVWHCQKSQYELKYILLNSSKSKLSKLLHKKNALYCGRTENSACHLKLFSLSFFSTQWRKWRPVHQLMARVNKRATYLIHLGGGKENVTSECSARVSFVEEELIKCATVWCGTGVPGQPEASRCAVSESVKQHDALSRIYFIQPSKLESVAGKKEHLGVHSGLPDTLQKPRNLLHLG